jgi:Peptidase family M3
VTCIRICSSRLTVILLIMEVRHWSCRGCSRSHRGLSLRSYFSMHGLHRTVYSNAVNGKGGSGRVESAIDISEYHLIPPSHLTSYHTGGYYSYIFAKMQAAQIWHHAFEKNPLSRYGNTVKSVYTVLNSRILLQTNI